jgi:hypothetical protein
MMLESSSDQVLGWQRNSMVDDVNPGRGERFPVAVYPHTTEFT